MNVGMWEHPATQANVATLAARGAVLVGPDSGELAEGETGAGRLAAARARSATRSAGSCPPPSPRVRGAGGRASTLEGRRVLVTAGGTREPLDPVRFIGNRSSGRMGVALADEALARGADVTTLLCNAAVRPLGGEVVETPTAAALAAAVAERAPSADVVLMAAAVADYTPRSAAADEAAARGRVHARAGADGRHPGRASGATAGRARCSSASPPRRATASRGRARSGRARAST